jgi:hypothetical protein
MKMASTRLPRMFGVLACLSVALLVPSCGSSSSATTSATPVTTMPAPVTTALFTGTLKHIPPSGIAYKIVSVPTAGTLTAHFGWTHADDNFSVIWLQGSCQPCTAIPFTATQTSPTSADVTATATQGGAYTFAAQADANNPREESSSLQVTLTTP